MVAVPSFSVMVVKLRMSRKSTVARTSRSGMRPLA
jgi:hypothetical protein